MTPADLTRPFAESCCDGGECNAESAQPCGCDPGLDWLCARHAWQRDIRELIFNWKAEANDASAYDVPDTVSLVFLKCADELEALL